MSPDDDWDDDDEPRRAPAPTPEEPAPRRRGRQPNRWPDDLGPEDLEGYRRRFGLSEQRLADHLGVSLPTLRNWTKGGKAPAAERLDELRARLREDYVAPATPAGEGAPRRRGRPPRLAPAPGSSPPPAPSAPSVSSTPASRQDDGVDAGAAPAAPEPARTGSTAQAIAELAAAYLRTPGGQHLTPAELIALLERIRRTVE